MRQIQSSEVDTHLATSDEIAEAIGDIKEIQKRTGRVTVKEILSAIHEGHAR